MAKQLQKPMQIIENLAKQKTEWLKPFQEIYQKNREEKKLNYKKAK
ncbi:hypothetical protein [Chryseobacterium sp. Leaf180]|nr:hypothetical protein [Chryseobacterium sp. Leaf180]